MKKVLLIEDEDLIREGLCTLLSKLLDGKAEVICSCDGQEAMEAVDSNKFDVILTDLNMPNMNGESFLREYKQKYGDAYIIICSAHFDTYEVDNTLYDEFITKPCRTREIGDRILKIING